MTVTRIIMDSTRCDTMDGHELKRFVKGEVYDSRIGGMSALDGSITHSLIVKFLKHGWAHEQTWSEYFCALDARRREMLESADTCEEAKELIREQNARAAVAELILSTADKLMRVPNKACAGMPSVRAMMKNVNQGE